jgi:putative ABC transport system permease protein
VQDLRLAIRALTATPIVTSVAILSLALGIGANTAVFSLLDAVALKSLPIHDPDRLVMLSNSPYSYALYDEIRRHEQIFDGTAAYNCCGFLTMTVAGDAQALEYLWVSGDFFSTLGIPATVGRMLRPDDDRRGGGSDGTVAVISDRLWHQRFGGRSNIAGTSVTIEHAPVTIVGVMPPAFLGLEVGRRVDLILPAHAEPVVMPAIPFSDEVGFLSILGRLRPDRSLPATVDALRAVQPAIRAATMPKGRAVPGWLKAPLTLVPAGRGTSALRRQFERPLIVLLAVATLVLLIACGNLANLLLGRGAARRPEFAVRAALGASRWQIIRPLLAESVLLASCGTALGILFARWGERAITATLSTAVVPVVLDRSLDWRLFVFTMGTMTVAALLFGTAPARRATRVDPIEGLKAIGRGGMLEPRGRLSAGLLVAQVATSLLLVVAAVLFARTFGRLRHAPLGFDRDRVTIVTVTAPTVRSTERKAFYQQLVDAANNAPGVAAAGGSINPPLIGGINGDFVVSAPGMRPAADAEPISQANTVTPGWFNAEGIGLRAGRDFDDHDTLAGAHVMVVNEAFVDRLLGGRRDAVGARLALSYRIPSVGEMPYDTRSIVGVVGNSVYRSIRDTSKPTIYFPLAQLEGPVMWTNFYLSVRSQARSPRGLTRELTAALSALSPDLKLTFRPVSDQVDEALAQDRLVASLAGFVGALALLLAAIGLYGVTSYHVERQRSEIGIRLALGAQPNGVLRLMLSRVGILVGTGMVIGAIVSAWASRFAASLLFEVSPRDPAAFAGAVAVLGVVATIAAFLPARRASRIDPAQVLRES